MGKYHFGLTFMGIAHCQLLNLGWNTWVSFGSSLCVIALTQNFRQNAPWENSIHISDKIHHRYYIHISVEFWPNDFFFCPVRGLLSFSRTWGFYCQPSRYLLNSMYASWKDLVLQFHEIFLQIFFFLKSSFKFLKNLKKKN